MAFEIKKDVLVGYMEEAGVTEVIIPDCVTSIGKKAFSQCRNIKSITIPDGVVKIGENAFEACESLTDIVIPDSVMTIAKGAFSSCFSLTNVVIPSGITRIGDMTFWYCEKITHIEIPDTVTSIGWRVFNDCISLTSVVIPDSVTSIGDDAFDGCTNLKDITSPPGLVTKIMRSLEDTELDHTISIHTTDIAAMGYEFRPGAAVGFAEDGRSVSDEDGKKYAKYIKANAGKLAGVACEHPALLYLMIREKLIAAKDLEVVSQAVQDTGNPELIAAMLEYGNTDVSEKEKVKAREKKETREEKVSEFVLDTEKLEVLKGKTFVVTGKLKSFSSRDELKECLSIAGATLTETMGVDVDYLLTNTPNSGTAKNKKAEEIGITKITEDELNEMIGRRARSL